MEKNTKTALISLTAIFVMLGVAYLFPPLYDLFCRVTGFDGTTQVAEQAPRKILDQKIEVIFTATTHPDLPWEFKPKQPSMMVRIGEVGLAFYRAKNISDKPVTGMALYNVSPNKMGAYFNKIHCFCFEQQLLMPGQEVDMPVTFFIDPEMVEDSETQEVRQIALNYIFQAQ